MIGIPDSSSLILLDAIGMLPLLIELFDRVVVAEAVAAEVVGNVAHPTSSLLAEFVATHQELPVRTLPSMSGLGAGEAQVLALALLNPSESVVILDDRPARAWARELGLRIVGTAGLLVDAKHAGQVQEVSSLLDDLRNAGMYLGQQTLLELLIRAGELPDEG